MEKDDLKRAQTIYTNHVQRIIGKVFETVPVEEGLVMCQMTMGQLNSLIDPTSKERGEDAYHEFEIHVDYKKQMTALQEKTRQHQ